MKSRKLSILVAVSMFAFAGSSAFANDKWLGDRGDNWEEHIVSTKSRAQVIAELNDARARGVEIGASETDYPRLPVATSGRTREAVKAELAEWRKNPVFTIDYISGG